MGKRAVGYMISLFALIGVLACALFTFLLLQAPVFEGGSGYTLYLGASSSQLQLISDDPLADKLLNSTAGESVQYEGDLYEAIKEKYRAELLFTERACGVVSYYLQSPYLSGGVMLNGVRVNLQIAVKEGRTCAGTPLIFGGF